MDIKAAAITGDLSQDTSVNIDREQIERYIEEILEPSKREVALAELSKFRESYPDLAIILWESFGKVPH